MRSLLFLLAFLIAALPALPVKGHETFYLRDDGTFDPMDASDTLSLQPPGRASVLDYDADGWEGLTIARGLPPSHPMAYQAWSTRPDSIDRLMAGTAEVHFYSKLSSYLFGSRGSLMVGLFDDSASVLTPVGTPAVISEDPWGLSWTEKVAVIPIAGYTLRQGHRLTVLIREAGTSDDDVLIAYDAVTTPSLILLPTVTTLMVQADADSIPPTVAAGTTDVNLLTIDLDPKGFGIRVDSLALELFGSGNLDADVTAVRLYLDDGPASPGRFDPLDDPVIATSSYAGGRTVLRDLALTLAGGPATLFAAHDISPAAINGNRVGCLIRDAGSLWTSADTVRSPTDTWPQPDSLVATTIVNPSGAFVINEVRTDHEFVLRRQTEVDVAVVVTNSMTNDAGLTAGGLVFSLTGWNDRAGDYLVTPSPLNPDTIIAGTTDTLYYQVDVAGTAVMDSTITIDAAYDIVDLGTMTPQSIAGAAIPDSWRVIAGNFRILAYLFATANSPQRWDDSLVAYRDIPGLAYDTPFTTPGTFGTIVQDDTTGYRFVLELNPLLAHFNYDADAPGDAYWALVNDTYAGFATAGTNGPEKELLLATTKIPDELTSPLDHLRALTKDTLPAQPWDPLTDPFNEPIVQPGTAAEVGALATGLTVGVTLDCLDGGGAWEVTKNIEAGRFFISEFWFRPDMEWSPGDTALLTFHMNGEGPGAPAVEAVTFPLFIADDDTIGPVITNLTPPVVTAGDSIDFLAAITDTSGVYDDSTGSAGQGVYLLWDTDGELATDAMEMTMSSVGGDTFASDYPLPPQPAGTDIVYQVFAYDDDNDGGVDSDRAQGSGAIDTVTVEGEVILVDSAGTLYPASASTEETFLALHIDLNNLSSQGVSLDTSSAVSFGDGTHTYLAPLANSTYVPPEAIGFTLSFAATAVPESIAAPASYPLELYLYGYDDSGHPFADTIVTDASNRLFVDVPKIHLSARPLSVSTAYAGKSDVPLLALTVRNGYREAKLLDTLAVTNFSWGAGSSEQLDGEIDSVLLYWDIDSSATISAADSFLAGSSFRGGMAVFVLAEPWSSSPLTTAHLLVTACIDSYLACDGDVIDAAVLSPLDLHFAPEATVAFTFSPLDPLDSYGYAVVDGMVTHQVRFSTSAKETLFAGEQDVLLASLELPPNGYLPDTLSAVEAADFGGGFDPSDLAALKLYSDDGDGLFSPGSDSLVGKMVFTGDRYSLSGLSLPLTTTSPCTFFLAGDVADKPGKDHRLRLGVPTMGIEVASDNDGPWDGPVVAEASYPFFRCEEIRISSLAVPPSCRPGDRTVSVLFLSIANNTSGTVTLDTLELTNCSRGPGSQSDKDGEVEFLTFIGDDGDGELDAWDTVLAESLVFAGGKVRAAPLGLTIAPDSTTHLLVQAAIDSFASADGDSIAALIADPNSLAFTGPHPVAGSFPLETPLPVAIDGSLAHQFRIHPWADSLVITATTDIPVFDFCLPANGYRPDTVKALTIVNLGSATEEHIASLRLYRDGGDNVPDAGWGDDSLVASFDYLGSKTYRIEGLAFPLDSLGGAGPRCFVVADLRKDFATAASIRFEIPLLGMEVTSGNDGPIDLAAADPYTKLIPKPNEVTMFPYSVGDKRVHAGDQGTLNFGLGCYNGYSTPIHLDKMKLFPVGTVLRTEIDSIYAYTDSDTNGLFNPDKDVLLAKGSYENGYYVFDRLSLKLRSRKITYLFIAYDLSMQVRDSVTVDFQLNGNADVFFDAPSVSVEGEFPINSPGEDLTDGMTAAQIALFGVPGYKAAGGEDDVLGLDIIIPGNGFLSDELQRITVANSGTALPGSDLREIKLWKEQTGTGFRPEEDTFLADLYWNGSVWESPPLSVYVPPGGLRCYLTFSVSSNPTDGATFRGAIPLLGIQVASGNDGPIDLEVSNPYSQVISTDPLLSSLAADRSTYSIGQNMQITMMVRNQGADTLRSIAPSSLTLAGTGKAHVLSGPVPARFDLSPGGDSTFVWALQADSAGRIELCAMASADSSEVSEVDCTTELVLQSRTPQVPLVLTDLAPASVNRGQGNVAFFKGNISCPAADSLRASVVFGGYRLTFTDGNGAPAPPQLFLSSVTLFDSKGNQVTGILDGSTTNPLDLTYAQPTVVQPGEGIESNLLGQVSDSASTSSFALRISASADVLVFDANDSFPANISASLPWSTSTVEVEAPVGSLLVTAHRADTTRANVYQTGIEALKFRLGNPGGVDASSALVTDLDFSFFSPAGLPVAPSSVIRRLEVRAGGSEVYASEDIPLSGSLVACPLSSPLFLAPQTEQDIAVRIDAKGYPSADSFLVTVASPTDISARDYNTGEPVFIASADSISSFPLPTRLVVLEKPPASVAVRSESDPPPYILPGAMGVALMNIVMEHGDSVGTASLYLDSLALSLTDGNGIPIDGGNLLAGLTLRWRSLVLGQALFFPPPGQKVELAFSSPLSLPPGSAETLQVELDLKSNLSPASLVLSVDREDLPLRNANDHSLFYGFAGDFPLTSKTAQLQVPTRRAVLDLVELAPANVTADQKEVEVIRLVVRNEESAGHTPVAIRRINIEAVDSEGNILDPGGLGVARIASGDGSQVAGTNAGGRFSFAFPDSFLITTAGEADTLTMILDLTSRYVNRNVTLLVPDSLSATFTEVTTGDTVAVASSSGLFPLRADPFHVLGTSAEQTFTNYPNPFAAGREKTRITFYLQEPALVSLKVFTLWGAPVITMFDHLSLGAGLHQENSWDGKNEDGETVNNGVYYLVLEVHGQSGKNFVLKRKVGVIR